MDALAELTRRSIAFAGLRLDRADHVRSDPVAVARLMDRNARLLLLDGLDPRFGDDNALVWGTLADVACNAELVLLGLTEQGHARFVAPPTADAANVSPPNPRLWQVMSDMPMGDLAIYGTARSLAGWHARHRFCAVCGHATLLAKAGWQRSCTNDACGAEHFPRTDPVVIMLVEHDGRLLLGRQPRFPPKRYSALAGFLEPGESLEEAVAREVFEEAGVRVGGVSYVASQPWPFPSSLMIGCHAMATTSELTIDGNELEDARWFTRCEVIESMAAGERGEVGEAFGAPPHHAVAWHLVDWWLKQAVK
jgi:NAD+ diphosphatase